MNLIAIETSTNICSIAYIHNGICKNIIEDKIPRKHAEKLPLFYEELVNNINLKLSDIDAIAISIGPGSFTGLRIGLSYAKGLSYSHQKPIVPVPTMLSLVQGSGKTFNNIVVIMLSHGNKYFVQKFNYAHDDLKLNKIQIHELDNINDLKELTVNSTIIHYGCDKIFTDAENKVHTIEVKPSSKWIGELAHQNYENWIIHKPYNLVPDYIYPFKTGK